MNNKPITCLGLTFTTEDERREYFRNELRAKLPELKKIEGYPIGEDDDIINLSDPPYYTACPNPWLNDFIAEWEKEKENITTRKNDFHVDEPYANDVSEGKKNPIYNAHSYHTKVPHPAIMRYILHYTQPGDTILDGFAGTGMTGVASQFCHNPDPETKLVIENEFRNMGLVTPKWGRRNAICGDLSPIATYIAYTYNSPKEIFFFQEEIESVLKSVEEECGWMYKTKNEFSQLCNINYTVFSDVFICPTCNGEIIFFDVAFDLHSREVKSEFQCPNCKSNHTKRTVTKAKVTDFDPIQNKSLQRTKTVPVLINYTQNNKRLEKRPDNEDILLLQRIEEIRIPYWYPTSKIETGDKTGEPFREGISHVHHFYSKRSLYLLSYIKFLTSKSKLDRELWFLFEQWVIGLSHLNRYSPSHFSQNNRNLAGTMYIGSQKSEVSFYYAFPTKIRRVLKAFSFLKNRSIITTGSANKICIDSNSVDYIFTDPPFGSNLMYSELNFLWESWLNVKTNNLNEAIENKSQGKTLLTYNELMTNCFHEYFRVLKPGKWMTVEFSSTKAAVWNGIQTAIQKAGFVIANVAALDKQQGGFNAVNNPTSVKQDLVISCYKPSFEFENKFSSLMGDMAVWDFVSEHLHHLPIHIKKENTTTAIIERSPKILFDRLITFYLMRGLPVPIDARDFQEGLKQKFIERDGMYFTSEQAAEYDEKKAKTSQFVQLSLIVTTENDAIEWLKYRLRKQAQKYQDIMPEFRIATQSLRKGDSLPELQEILNENFIEEADGKWRTPDPNEAKDRELLRKKVLLKEFNRYIEELNKPKAKKLREVRVEALRTGFNNCWEQKDFKTIVKMGNIIPQNILLEDETLLMYYDIAKDRL